MVIFTIYQGCDFVFTGIFWQTDTYKYLVYKPSGGDARVRAERETLYYRTGDEALYAGAEGYSVDITWISNMSWRNDTDAAQTYTHTFTTELKITQGSEVTTRFSLGVTYKGACISFNHQMKLSSRRKRRSRGPSRSP